MNSSFDYLNRLREEELRLTLERHLQVFEGRRVLEIGSGTGAQLALLSDICALSVGIDLPGSLYVGTRLADIVNYGGHVIPFADQSFDTVYSSNVLEHVQHQAMFHAEMRRVLRPGGQALHIMPTHTWRMWSHVTHYPALPSKIRQYRQRTADGPGTSSPLVRQQSRWRLLGNVLVDPRHGEFGNRLSEVAAFHPNAWRQRLAAGGWEILDDHPTGLFYTGGNLFGTTLSFSTRRRLAAWFGSACHTYHLTRGPAG